MLQLLKIEWLKVKNYRTFWILTILFVVSIFGINYIVHEIQAARPGGKQMDAAAAMLLGSPPFRFPDVWHTVTYVSSFLLFIPSLLLIISMTNEYSFKTHRQNIIDGLSRTAFIMAKIADVVIVSLACTILVAITALLFGIIEGNASFSLEKSEYVLYFFLQALSYCSVSLLLSVLLKRSGITIGVFFLYIAILERMVAGLLTRFGAGVAGDFLPLRAPNGLIPLPFFRAITNQFFKSPDTLYLLIATLIYLTAYIVVVKRRVETVDL